MENIQAGSSTGAVNIPRTLQGLAEAAAKPASTPPNPSPTPPAKK
jgi:hypothetical protein